LRRRFRVDRRITEHGGREAAVRIRQCWRLRQRGAWISSLMLEGRLD
jgi:hypothetical protein